MLVIAPLRVCQLVWPAEAKKWDDFSHFRVALLHGSKKDEFIGCDFDIFLINPEGLPWLLAEGRLKKLGIDTLCIDESSKFKNSTGQRYKLLKKQLGTFSRRWILTGSPAANGLLDLFGQIYILDYGRALGRYITHYRNEFFDSTGFGGFKWKPVASAEERISERIDHLVVRLKAEDYLTLPKLITQNIWVELPPKARAVYEDLEDEMFHAMDDGATVKALTAAAVSMKCRQIASGAVYTATIQSDHDYSIIQDKKLWAHIHDEKIEALKDLIEERGGKPLLVAYQFGHELKRLHEAFGDVPYLGAGVTGRRAKTTCDAWNAGDLPLMFGQPSSMGHGLNLQEGTGDAIAWFSLTWNYDDYDQLIRRLRRQGSKHDTIFVYHLLARSTVDEALARSVLKKAKTQNNFLDMLKTYRRSKK